MSYYCLLTTAGQAKVAAAIASGTPVAITQMALGDGGGAPVTPVENRSALVNEVNRGAVESIVVHPTNPNWLTVQRIIGPEIGGWTVREIGLFDASNTLIAYGNFPPSYKPVLAEGSGKELIVRAQFEVSSTAAISISIDPSVVLASQAWVQQQITALQRANRARRFFHNQS